jgi:hypothetical protein
VVIRVNLENSQFLLGNFGIGYFGNFVIIDDFVTCQIVK